MTAYKRILIHAEVREHGVGNCVPLQKINILKCSLNVYDKKLNSKNKAFSMENLEKNLLKNVTFDHDYDFCYNLSIF